MPRKNNLNRRRFLGTAASASLAFSIVPRNVLGKGHVAPSDQLRMAYIGCGTQGIREMHELIKNPKIRITSVCDPNKFTTDYRDWSTSEIRNRMREATGNANWGAALNGIPGGRDVGQEMVQQYYGRTLPSGTYKGCASYEDFRELLEKEQDYDAVKIMTPDHLHATISIAAMKKGKQVVIHKPIANRMYEARLTIDTARKTGVSTHLLAWSKISGNDTLKKMIDEGAIGTLKSIHNWSNRPVWPQWDKRPTEPMAVPEGMNWDLWLGPEKDRPYHINYTHMTFRGWYDFGGGTIADMGHYSLWPLFLTLGITRPPVSAEACAGTTREFVNQVSREVKNDVAFPLSCMVRFKFPEQEKLPAFDLCWYDGGMKPPMPEGWGDQPMPAEGMMIVGDKGVVMAGFNCESPTLVPEQQMRAWQQGRVLPKDKEDRNENHWIDAFLQKKESPGSFLLAGCVTETIQLGAVAIRNAGKRLLYDSQAMKITNHSDANRFFYREYRKGWEL
jgi:predicted dehydrogenase